jgi:hypothetical protein
MKNITKIFIISFLSLILSNQSTLASSFFPTETNGTTITNGTVTEAKLSTSDNTTLDCTTLKHGFTPKGLGLGYYLRDDCSWQPVSGGATLSNRLDEFASPTSSLTFKPSDGIGLKNYYNAASATGSFLNTYQSRGTFGSETATQNADILGGFGAFGYGTSYVNSGRAYFKASQTHTGSVNGTDFFIETTPFNSNTRIIAGAFVGPHLFMDNDTNNIPTIFLQHHGSSSASVLEYYKSRGTSASPTALSSGDEIGGLNFRGFGTFYVHSARIYAKTNQAFTGSAGGTSLFFETTPNNSVTKEINMILGNDGNLTLGSTANSTSGTGNIYANQINLASSISTTSVSSTNGSDFSYSTNASVPTTSLLGSGYSALVSNPNASANWAGIGFNVRSAAKSLLYTEYVGSNQARFGLKLQDGSSSSYKALEVDYTGSGNLGKENFVSGSAQTTTTALTTIYTLALADNTSYIVTAKSLGKKSDRSQHANYKISASFERHSGGSATRIGGTDTIIQSDETDATYNCAWTTSGNNALFQCAGNSVGAETVNWDYYITYELNAN